MKINKYPLNPILFIDDEIKTLEISKLTLSTNGINNVICCSDSRKVISILKKNKISLILLDLSMPFISGEELFSLIAKDFPEIPVIIITGLNDVEIAVRCMKNGVFDYIVKPVDENRLLSGIKRAIEFKELKKEISSLKNSVLEAELKHPYDFQEIITQNKSVFSLFKYAEAISSSRQPVLITGETGVGKELMAQVIHNSSKAKGDFISVNVAGLDDNIFSDTLFGHKKGAFTGANSNRNGMIEKASNGTILLDEIADISPLSQVKLLSFLQNGQYLPLGSDQIKQSNARVILATNKDLKKLINKGLFRKDLYYRLHTHQIHIPPLRKRLDDLPLLIQHFVNKAAKSLNKKPLKITETFISCLEKYHFPGNIRELESIIFNAVSETDKTNLQTSSLKNLQIEGKSSVCSSEKPQNGSHALFTNINNLPSFKECEKILVKEALLRTNNNQAQAAKILGISRQALNLRIKKDL